MDKQKMLDKDRIEQRRSPRALYDFVVQFMDIVRANQTERHRGILKENLYKQFLDEIVPLSIFALQIYPPNYEIQPVLGNQGYDAIVFNELKTEIDRIEMTIPHDGAALAKDSRLVVAQGYGQIQVGSPGDDFVALFPQVLATCRKKSLNDYNNCTLVIAISPMPPFKSFEVQHEKNIDSLVAEIVKIKFKAKRVYLLVLPDRVMAIQGV